MHHITISIHSAIASGDTKEQFKTMGYKISIHSAIASGDLLVGSFVDSYFISIHSAIASGDEPQNYQKPIDLNFNPLRHR